MLRVSLFALALVAPGLVMTVDPAVAGMAIRPECARMHQPQACTCALNVANGRVRPDGGWEYGAPSSGPGKFLPGPSEAQANCMARNFPGL